MVKVPRPRLYSTARCDAGVAGWPGSCTPCAGSHAASPAAPAASVPRSFDVLRKLVLPDGTVLRALLPGRPTRDSLFADVLRDGASLLKVGAAAGALGGGSNRAAQGFGAASRAAGASSCEQAGGIARVGCCWSCLLGHVLTLLTYDGSMPSAPPPPPQIWNINATTGVVGVFNLQGASWDRSRRRFHIHASTPPELSSESALPPACPSSAHNSDSVWAARRGCTCCAGLLSDDTVTAGVRGGLKAQLRLKCASTLHPPGCAAVVRPTDIELFRQQLESLGCDVAGALAAARREEAAAAAAQANRSWHGRPSASPSGTAATAGQRQQEETQQSSGAAPRSGLSAGNASPNTAPGWVAAGTSFMSSDGAAGRRRDSEADAPDEDEEAAPRAAVPDFAVYVGATDDLHRVSWDKGVPVRLTGELPGGPSINSRFAGEAERQRSTPCLMRHSACMGPPTGEACLGPPTPRPPSPANHNPLTACASHPRNPSRAPIPGWEGTVVTMAPISRFEFGGSSSAGAAGRQPHTCAVVPAAQSAAGPDGPMHDALVCAILRLPGKTAIGALPRKRRLPHIPTLQAWSLRPLGWPTCSTAAVLCVACTLSMLRWLAWPAWRVSPAGG